MKNLVKNIKRHSRVSFFLKYFTSYIKLNITAIVLALVVTGLALIPPKLMGDVVNLLTDKNYPFAVKMVILVILITFFKAILEYILNRIFIHITNDVGARMRNDIFSKVLNSDNVAFSDLPPGELNSKVIMDVENISLLFSKNTITLIVDILKIIGIITVLFLISTKLTFVASLQMIPAILIFIYFFPRIYKKSGNLHMTMDTLFSLLFTYIQGLKTIKLLVIEKRMLKKLNESVHQLKDNNYSLGISQAKMNLVLVFFPIISHIIVWIIGGYLIYTNELKIGDLITLELYIMLIGEPFSNFSYLGGTISLAMASLDRIISLLKDIDGHNDETAINLTFQGKIALNKITFSYPGPHKHYIYKDFSTTFDSHSFNAIIGKSGVGKSTLAHLLIRSIEVSSGHIVLENHTNIKCVPKKQLRQNICLVEGDSVLFGSTLREVLMLPGNNRLDREVGQILRNLCLNEFAELIENGEDYDIGINGDKVSDGQRHRISITRCLLIKPKVLIIDEALQSLDIYIEHKVIKTLKSYLDHMTIILITHSLNFMNYFDKVLLLREDNEKASVSTHIFTNPQREEVVQALLYAP